MVQKKIWKTPHIIKIYEALGSIVDERLEIINNLEGKLYSSSRQKFYSIKYDPKNNSIMSNDNASFYCGTLGYPAIAYLMKMNFLPYDENYAILLKNIYWKKLNQKFDKNKGKAIPDYDFDAVVKEVDSNLIIKGHDINAFKIYVNSVYEKIKKTNYFYLGEKQLPPKGD